MGLITGCSQTREGFSEAATQPTQEDSGTEQHVKESEAAEQLRVLLQL